MDFIGKVMLITGVILSIFVAIFYYFMLPSIMEKRFHDLNLVEYRNGKFVGKDSVVINEYDLHYIKYGNMNLKKK